MPATPNALTLPRPQPSHKSFKIKRILGKKQKQNRPIPQWIRLRTDNTIRCALRSCRLGALRCSGAQRHVLCRIRVC